MYITLQIDSVNFNSKPGAADIAGIKRRMAAAAPVTLSLEDFAGRVTSGCSFSPGILEGGAKAENWKCQYIFGLDFDNEDKSYKPPKGKPKRQAKNPLNVSAVLDRCKDWGLSPALIYETFSSKPEWLKMRVIFVSDKHITDSTEREDIQLTLMDIFPECDSTCKNADRFFYGGKKILHMDNNAVMDTGAVKGLRGLFTLAAPAPMSLT